LIDIKDGILMIAGQKLHFKPFNKSVSIDQLNMFVKQDPPDQLFDYEGEHPLHKMYEGIPKIHLDLNH
jgi:hypothetical protein